MTWLKAQQLFCRLSFSLCKAQRVGSKFPRNVSTFLPSYTASYIVYFYLLCSLVFLFVLRSTSLLLLSFLILLYSVVFFPLSFHSFPSFHNLSAPPSRTKFSSLLSMFFPLNIQFKSNFYTRQLTPATLRKRGCLIDI